MPIFDYLAGHGWTANYFGDLMSRTTAIIEEHIASARPATPAEPLLVRVARWIAQASEATS